MVALKLSLEELEDEGRGGVGLLFDSCGWLWPLPAGDQCCDGHVPSAEVVKET